MVTVLTILVLHNNFFQSNSPICSFISVPTATTLFRFLLALAKTNAKAFHLASHLWFSLDLATTFVFLKVRLFFYLQTKTCGDAFLRKVQMS
jgi:hypothetical protein